MEVLVLPELVLEPLVDEEPVQWQVAPLLGCVVVVLLFLFKNLVELNVGIFNTIANSDTW